MYINIYYICIYVYTYIRVHLYAYICMSNDTHTRGYANMHVCMYTYMYMYTCMHMSLYAGNGFAWFDRKFPSAQVSLCGFATCTTTAAARL